MAEVREHFYFWAIGARGSGISGSDRIFIELARRWGKIHPVTIIVWSEGLQMCKRAKLEAKKITFRLVNLSFFSKFGFFVSYLGQIIMALVTAFTIRLENSNSVIHYSASDFWMDTFPAVICKIRKPNNIWIATWYQTAPSPLKGFSEGLRDKSYRKSAFFYWFMQLPVKPFIKLFADYVIVNNEDERKQFPKLNKAGKVFVLIGAVGLDEIDQFKRVYKKESSKKFDAVFQGRFHPQKGVVELVEIWKKVVMQKKDAKLVMIGDGPLMGDVVQKITQLKLEKNITLLGYVFDGEQKYKAFQQSKLVMHPAFYDSGGMAAAEAMAFGLPGVGFQLKAYKSYYPKGLVTVPVGNKNAFAQEILKFLKDKKLREKVGKDAEKMIYQHYSWNKRAEELLSFITTV